MSDKYKIGLLGIRPVHPGRGESSRIELNIELRYLKGTPIATIILTKAEVIELLAQAATALRAVAS